MFVQEVDLERLRDQWLVTLTQRQEYLDQQLQKIVCKPGTAVSERSSDMEADMIDSSNIPSHPFSCHYALFHGKMSFPPAARCNSALKDVLVLHFSLVILCLLKCISQCIIL